MDRDTIERTEQERLFAARNAYRMLTTAIVLLPDGPNLIAATLDSYKVKGKPGECATCALAEFLSARTGYDVIVGGSEATICLPDDFVTAALPLAARTFVVRFDKGRYPHLNGRPTRGVTKRVALDQHRVSA